jgi:Icc-related predicted phosphoesterase
MNEIKKIRHISDTHGRHEEIKLIECDIIIHTGDESNNRNSLNNEVEFMDFIEWYKNYPANHKILVPGNHSSFIYERPTLAKTICKKNGITLLIDELVTIEEISIFGTPVTHEYGQWCFMTTKDKIGQRSRNYPKADILATHGPSYGMLDCSPFNYELCGELGHLKYCQRHNPLLHLFGHIHSSYKSNIINTGIRENDLCKTVFSNAAAISDGDRDGKYSLYQGNMFTIKVGLVNNKLTNKKIIRL